MVDAAEGGGGLDDLLAGFEDDPDLDFLNDMQLPGGPPPGGPPKPAVPAGGGQEEEKKEDANE